MKKKNLGSWLKPTKENKLPKESYTSLYNKIKKESRNIELSKKEKDHIHSYKCSSFTLNSVLREKREKVNVADTYYDIDNIYQRRNILINLCKKYTLKSDIVLYRGNCSVYHSKKYRKKGNIIDEPYFLSTSFKKGTAASFGSVKPNTSKRVIHKIYAPKGTKGFYIDVHSTHHDHEQEFLLPPETKFKVLGHSEDYNYHYVHMKIIDQEL